MEGLCFEILVNVKRIETYTVFPSKGLTLYKKKEMFRTGSPEHTKTLESIEVIVRLGRVGRGILIWATDVGPSSGRRDIPSSDGSNASSSGIWPFTFRILM